MMALFVADIFRLQTRLVFSTYVRIPSFSEAPHEGPSELPAGGFDEGLVRARRVPTRNLTLHDHP